MAKIKIEEDAIGTLAQVERASRENCFVGLATRGIMHQKGEPIVFPFLVLSPWNRKLERVNKEKDLTGCRYLWGQ